MAYGFSTPDYVVFAVMLLISAAIGVWYGCGPGGKQTSTKEYLLADRSMKIVPVAISLLVSYLSAITLLGVPSEIYTYGGQYYVLIVSYFIVCGTVGIIFVPMFRRINITCVNEYLERRFSPGVRTVGCVFFIVEYTLYLFVVLYAPALALEAVAHLPLTASILTIGAVCTFYTSLGGLKAVIWTDVFQATVMVGGLIAVAIQGSIEVGGLSNVWKINKEFQRLNMFDFNPDPKVRNTFWTLTIGGALTAMPVWTVSQTAVQRFLAIRTLKDAKRAVWLNIPGLIFVVTLCTLDGMVIFAVYSGCDLRLQGKVTSNDQVLPYFVIDKLGHLTGLPGLFMACLFAGALSTASSALNAMALVCLEDIVKKKKKDITDNDAAKMCKIISLAFGVLVVAGTFIVQFVGTMVLQLAYSIFGIVGGPLFGTFFMGMFVRRANYKGAYAGVFAGAALTTWVFIGAQVYPPNKYPGLRSIQECKPGDVTNATLRKYPTGLIENPHVPHSDGIADFYSISYFWFSGLSMMTSFVIGVVVSLITENEEDRKRARDLDPRLLFPVKQWFMGFLPGHKFEWDIEDPEDEMAEDDPPESDMMKLGLVPSDKKDEVEVVAIRSGENDEDETMPITEGSPTIDSCL